MSQLNVGRRGVHRWTIGPSFTRLLIAQCDHLPFSLLFAGRNDNVSFRWNEQSKTAEINFAVNVRIGGESGKILLNQWWQVSNLRCNTPEYLMYSEKIDPWTSWTYVEVEVRDFKRICRSGKATWSHRIYPARTAATTNVEPNERQSAKQSDPTKLTWLHRIYPTSTSTATTLWANEVQSGKRSDPVKPVVKTEPIESSAVQFGLKSSSSAIDSASIEQPPLKRQKIDQPSTPVAHMDVNSAATAVVMPSPTTKLVGTSNNNNQSVDDDFIRTFTAKVAESSQLREENLRLTSTVAELQRKLNENDTEALLKWAEKTSELSQLQLNCDRSVAKLTGELNIQLETICKMRDQQDLMSEAFKKLQVELQIKCLRLEKATSELEQNKAKLIQLTSELSNQQQLNSQNSEVIKSQSNLMVEKWKVEENLRAQLVGLKKFCEGNVAKLLSFDTLIFTIRLADQLSSDLLMTKSFEFVQREKANEQMWKDLHLHLQLPNILAQISIFIASGEDAKLPKFHFTAGIRQ